jgi:hypothetical protein
MRALDVVPRLTPAVVVAIEEATVGHESGD